MYEARVSHLTRRQDGCSFNKKEENELTMLVTVPALPQALLKW